MKHRIAERAREEHAGEHGLGTPPPFTSRNIKRGKDVY